MARGQATDAEEIERALEEAVRLRAEVEAVRQEREEARAQVSRLQTAAGPPQERIALMVSELTATKEAAAQHLACCDHLSAALSAAEAKVCPLTRNSFSCFGLPGGFVERNS